MDRTAERGDIGKEDLFRFVVLLGIFSGLEMDIANFSVMNRTACALLQENGLFEDFKEYSSQEMKIPQHILAVGHC